MKSLVQEIRGINEKVTILEDAVNRQEQYLKANNLIIYGIQEDTDENILLTEEKVISLINNKLNLNISTSEINRCYRISKRKPNSHRPILIQFLSYKSKANVYHAKKLLKKTGFVIKEDLTKSNLELVKAAATKYGLSNVWTQDGKVFVVKNGFKTIVRNVNELNG